MARLPKPGSDQGKWGEILNDYLSQAHTDTGTLKDNTVTSATIAHNTITEDNLTADIVAKLNSTSTGTTSATPDTIVQRTSTGTIKIADAVEDDEAVALGQADAVVSRLAIDPDSATRITLDSTYARSIFFKRMAGTGITNGDIIEIGKYAHTLRIADAGTCLVVGGAENYENVIGGELSHVNTPASNLDVADVLSGTNGLWDFIIAGYDNVVNGWATVVAGFHIRVGLGANHATVSGGSLHEVPANSSYATIGGGTRHVVGSGIGDTVSGGEGNNAKGGLSSVGGELNNIASGNATTIADGTTNTASAQSATIAGGFSNTASATSASVNGGQGNTASGTGSTVLGGRGNVASGEYSTAMGREAVATNGGEVAQGGGCFVVAGDAQASRVVLKRTTTDATASDLWTTANLPLLCSENTTWGLRATIIARSSVGDSAAWEVRGLYGRGLGNTGTWVGMPTITLISASAGASMWNLATGSYSVGNLRFIVTGAIATNIRWVGEVDITQVKYEV